MALSLLALGVGLQLPTFYLNLPKAVLARDIAVKGQQNFSPLITEFFDKKVLNIL